MFSHKAALLDTFHRKKVSVTFTGLIIERVHSCQVVRGPIHQWRRAEIAGVIVGRVSVQYHVVDDGGRLLGKLNLIRLLPRPCAPLQTC